MQVLIKSKFTVKFHNENHALVPIMRDSDNFAEEILNFLVPKLIFYIQN